MGRTKATPGQAREHSREPQGASGDTKCGPRCLQMVAKSGFGGFAGPRSVVESVFGDASVDFRGGSSRQGRVRTLLWEQNFRPSAEDFSNAKSKPNFDNIAPRLGQNIVFGTKLSAQRRGFFARETEIKLRERRCDDAGLSRQDLVRTLLWE